MKYQISEDTWVQIDPEDLEHVERHKWSPRVHPKTTYAQANVETPDGRSTITLHRFIARAQPFDHVDHKNADGLDNRKINLRVCKRFQNNRYARKRDDNTSGYRGVSFYKAGDRYSAYIMIDNKHRHIAYFDSAEQAAHAYDAVAQREYGDFAWLNFPDRRLTEMQLEAYLRSVLGGRKSFIGRRYA